VELSYGSGVDVGELDGLVDGLMLDIVVVLDVD